MKEVVIEDLSRDPTKRKVPYSVCTGIESRLLFVASSNKRFYGC